LKCKISKAHRFKSLQQEEKMGSRKRIGRDPSDATIKKFFLRIPDCY